MFKGILQAFFEDFLALFLPDIVAKVEPGSSTFLNPETITDIPTGARRQAIWVRRGNSCC